MDDNRQFETIKVAIEGPLGRLTLNRPDRLNAISGLTLRELADAAHWFDDHSEVRVVILNGAGRAFTAGADLRGSGAPAQSDPVTQSWHYRREVGQSGLRAADAIEQMRAVTIVAVHGYSVGGGVVLMSACDLRVVADDAVMFIPEIDLGIPLTWGAIPRLVRDIGPAMTKELVMTCRRFTAQEAKEIGFVNRVVPAAQLTTEIEALARELIARPSAPVAMTKEHVNAVSRAMGIGVTSFADGDLLMGAFHEPDSRSAAQEYQKKTFKKK